MKKEYSKVTRISMSVIALLLIAVLAISFTFSWSEGGKTGNVSSNGITISSGSDLTMRQDGTVTNSIIIPTTCKLQEVSSADGRNYFFPMTDNRTSITKDMTFREAVSEDENSRYLSLDFQLEAGDSAAMVFLGAGTIVQCNNNSVAKALRMSFSKNDGSQPIIFKPNQMPGVSDTMKYYPIVSITDDGKPTTGEVFTSAFGDYYYSKNNNNPLFSIENGQTLNLTLSIWLEGTDFTGNSVADSELNIYIDFTTNADELVKYSFSDNTHGYSGTDTEYWVTDTDVLNGNTYDTMMYIYDTVSCRYYAMKKVVDKTANHGAKWEVYVPDTIRSFTFRRYSIDIDQWWNEWSPNMSDIKTDPNGEHTFIAICGNGQSSGNELSGCYGYWQDSNDTIRIFFQLENNNWTDLKCYAWGSNDYYPLGVYPGKGMTYSHNAGSGNSTAQSKPVYYVDIKGASKIEGISFNSGSNKYEITDSKYFFNGFATWYADAANNGTAKGTTWIYRDAKNSLIYPAS